MRDATPQPAVLWLPWVLRRIAVTCLLILATLVGPPIMSLVLRPEQPREAVIALILGVCALLWQTRRASRAKLVLTADAIRGADGALPLAELEELWWEVQHLGGKGQPNRLHRLHGRTSRHSVELIRDPASAEAAATFSARLREHGLPVTPHADRGGPSSRDTGRR